MPVPITLAETPNRTYAHTGRIRTHFSELRPNPVYDIAIINLNIPTGFRGIYVKKYIPFHAYDLADVSRLRIYVARENQIVQRYEVPDFTFSSEILNRNFELSVVWYEANLPENSKIVTLELLSLDDS